MRNKTTCLVCLGFIIGLIFYLPHTAEAQPRRNSQEVIGADDEDDETEGPAQTAVDSTSDEAMILANGQQWHLKTGKELVLDRNRTYDVFISKLKPGTKVFVEFRKAGANISQQNFVVNQQGEFHFEYTTPNQRGGGEATVKYVAASGKNVELQMRVLLR